MPLTSGSPAASTATGGLVFTYVWNQTEISGITTLWSGKKSTKLEQIDTKKRLVQRFPDPRSGFLNQHVWQTACKVLQFACIISIVSKYICIQTTVCMNSCLPRLFRIQMPPNQVIPISFPVSKCSCVTELSKITVAGCDKIFSPSGCPTHAPKSSHSHVACMDVIPKSDIQD